MLRPILILGMHRSGTSLIAELIDKWGAFGNNSFLPTDYRNPQGYWEYEPLVHFNRRLLVSVGAQSFVPPSDQDAAMLRERASEPAWKNDAVQLLASMESGKRMWYWKDPRLSVTLPFWQQFWVNAVYVIAVREPLDIALSLKKIYNLPVTAGCLLWQRYMTAVLKYTEGHPQRIFVEYERILSTPADECLRLSNFLEESGELHDARTKSQRMEPMIAAVNPSLRTNASEDGFFAATEVSQGQKNLYSYLRENARSRDKPLDASAFEIYPGWRDYLLALAALDQAREALRRKEQTRYAKIRRKLSRTLLAEIWRKASREPETDDLPW